MTRPLAVVVSLLLALPALAAKPEEEALKRAFEGRWVRVKVDLPASHKGLDLRFDRERPMDMAQHADRLREYDVAIAADSRQQVTRVKLKDDMIEFHLGGGGFNWGSDTTTRSFTARSKTRREQDLDKEIKAETDRERRRRLERERDDLRDERERRDARERREVEDWNQQARLRDAERSLRSGSRINLRFKKRVPAEVLTSEGLERTLQPWVEMGGAAEPGGASTDPDADTTGGMPDAPEELRKGLLYDEVEALLGRALRRERCTLAEDLVCLRATFADPESDGEIEALFVQDVLVRFGPRQP
jgi:hypothetical protein